MAPGPDLTPIRTKYAGTLFRSRLEARWAVFFDATGIKWEFEPEGYKLSDGTCYLPDFFLPNFQDGIFAEVKPERGDFGKAKQFAREAKVNIWLCEGPPANRLYQVFGEKYEDELNLSIGDWEAVRQATSHSFWEPKGKTPAPPRVPLRTLVRKDFPLDWAKGWKPTAADVKAFESWGIAMDEGGRRVVVPAVPTESNCNGYEVGDAGWSACDDDCPSHQSP